jgi:hypothetical protein
MAATTVLARGSGVSPRRFREASRPHARARAHPPGAAADRKILQERPAACSLRWLSQGAPMFDHIGLRASVDRFHQRATAAGGRDHGASGLRPDYAPTYYAAFVLDPDSNNLEAVCMEAR